VFYYFLKFGSTSSTIVILFSKHYRCKYIHSSAFFLHFMNFIILFGISSGFFVGLQQTFSADTWTQTLWFFCFFFCTDCVCQDRSEGWASWNHCFYYWEGHGRVHPDSRKLRTLGVNVLIYFTYMFVGVFFCHMLNSKLWSLVLIVVIWTKNLQTDFEACFVFPMGVADSPQLRSLTSLACGGVIRKSPPTYIHT